MDAKTFGARIFTRRHELGLTQAALAQKVGVTDKAVSKWERGAGLPDVDLLGPLADALGMSVDELLRGEGAVREHASECTQSPEAGLVRRDEASTLARADVQEDTPTSRRRLLRSPHVTNVLPLAALALLVVVVLLAGQGALGGSDSTSAAAGDNAATSEIMADSAMRIEAKRAADKQSNEVLQLARGQQEWRMANQVWSSDDLQWDAVTLGGVSTIGAELKVREACRALGSGAFEPDFVSGVKTLRLEDGGESLWIEAAGTYAGGNTGTCSALVGGDSDNPVVQELTVARG